LPGISRSFFSKIPEFSKFPKKHRNNRPPTVLFEKNNSFDFQANYLYVLTPLPEREMRELCFFRNLLYNMYVYPKS
jgi:hypothetical protein